MRHHLNLDLADHQPREKAMGLRRVILYEHLARQNLGETRQFIVVVSGDSADQVTIAQRSDGGDERTALAEAVGVSTGGEAA